MFESAKNADTREERSARSEDCCAQTQGRGGGGFYSMKFYTGRFRPEVQPLTLSYTNFYRNGTPFIYLEENCTPFLYLKDKPKK